MVDLSMTVVVIAAFVFVSTQAQLSNVSPRHLMCKQWSGTEAASCVQVN